MNNIFIVSDFVELIALQRVFREAKFCHKPDDIEISDSPVVAQLFERLITTLIENDVERNGEDARLRWTQWLTIDESRDEWESAIRRALTDDRWTKFSSSERIEYIRVLLSPFTLTQEIIDIFISTVNRQLSE